ncbi:hypothetical protein HT746_01255 [Burkholderia pyrrocinia]|uniref:hypothetical protein n=1 Tax=Burkholderia pyrrocinia TaxID=60550 RepID=UPI0015774F81|nr:hypothetical protein [Burkholderia pyrrocinia]NTX25788.1 hypothetical protein [Burkholderia pyrrocinia]
MKLLSRLAIAALLAAAVAPTFARGMPQLPDDDGGRASVLRELNPTRVDGDARAHAAGVVPNQGGETDRKAATRRNGVSSSPSGSKALPGTSGNPDRRA